MRVGDTVSDTVAVTYNYSDTNCDFITVANWHTITVSNCLIVSVSDPNAHIDSNIHGVSICHHDAVHDTITHSDSHPNAVIFSMCCDCT